MPLIQFNANLVKLFVYVDQINLCICLSTADARDWLAQVSAVLAWGSSNIGLLTGNLEKRDTQLFRLYIMEVLCNTNEK